MTLPPYPPSWLDRLIARIERLPGSPWIFYLTVTVILVLINHGLRWLEGSEQVGVFNMARVIETPIVIYFLGLMHYLNKTAGRSMGAFRPALDFEDSEVARLRYELTVLPRSAGLAAAAAGLIVGPISVFRSPASWGIQPSTSPLVVGYAVLTAIASMSFVIAFLLHTVRQLRLVNRIHQMATNINLFERMAVHAFSALTARTGIGIIILVYYYVYAFFVLRLFGAGYTASPIDIALAAAILLLAVASFVLPLNGVHNQLVKEKTRLSAEADRRFEATLMRLHQHLDSGSLQEMEALNKALSSLVIERDALDKISTWPWRPETLRVFLTSVALPVLLWLVIGWLGRRLGI
jgi:hypothetical protein